MATKQAVEPKPVVFAGGAGFRRWLKGNHARATDILLCIHKAHAASDGITYSEALDEALCHGWIDGVRRRLDDRTFSIRFTPRQRRSIWSLVNVAKVEQLLAAGRMTQAGLDVYAAREAKRTGVYAFERTEAARFTPALAARFKADKAAWAWFQAKAPWYQRLAIHRVMSAKKDETRIRRFEELLATGRGTTR